MAIKCRWDRETGVPCQEEVACRARYTLTTKHVYIVFRYSFAIRIGGGGQEKNKYLKDLMVNLAMIVLFSAAVQTFEKERKNYPSHPKYI